MELLLMFTVSLCILIALYVVFIFAHKRLQAEIGETSKEWGNKTLPEEIKNGSTTNKYNIDTNTAIGIGAVGIASLVCAAYLLKSMTEDSNINYTNDELGTSYDEASELNDSISDDSSSSSSSTVTIEQLLIERDQTLRSRIRLHCHASLQTEHEIMYSIIASNTFRYSYPYLNKYEWEVIPGRPQYGRGDLVFADGKLSYLIVECKYINQNGGKTARSARRNKRRKVELQARRYAERFAQRAPWATRVGYVHITNERQASMETAEDRILYLDPR